MKKTKYLTEYFCDLCGKKIHDKWNTFTFTLKPKEYSDFTSYINADICYECKEKIEDFIDKNTNTISREL